MFFWRRRPRPPYVGDCPDCGHDWRMHPGGPYADPAEPVCDECGYEVGHEQRDAADACARPAPATP